MSEMAIQMISSSSSVHPNLNSDRESAARLIQKNYRATKANRVGTENAQISLVDLANIHSVESPLPLSQSLPGLMQPPNEMLLSAISLNPREPLDPQEDSNGSVFTGCTLEDFFTFFDGYKAQPNDNHDHLIKALMNEIDGPSIETNDFCRDTDSEPNDRHDHSFKVLMSEIYYGLIDVNDFYHNPDLKQKINSAANWLGIRNSGFLHIFRSSTSIDEVENKLRFEKNYCKIIVAKKIYNLLYGLILEFKHALASLKITNAVTSYENGRINGRNNIDVLKNSLLEHIKPLSAYHTNLSSIISKFIKSKSSDANLRVDLSEVKKAASSNSPLVALGIETLESIFL